MIVVRVAMNIKPSDLSNFVAACQDNVTESRKFDGCLKFEVFEDMGNENRLFLYEEWASLQHFDAYRHSDYFKASGAVLFPMIDGAPDTAYYQGEAIQ